MSAIGPMADILHVRGLIALQSAAGYEIHEFEPTKKQKREAEKALLRLPAVLLDHMTPIGRYVLPCP